MAMEQDGHLDVQAIDAFVGIVSVALHSCASGIHNDISIIKTGIVESILHQVHPDKRVAMVFPGNGTTEYVQMVSLRIAVSSDGRSQGTI